MLGIYQNPIQGPHSVMISILVSMWGVTCESVLPPGCQHDLAVYAGFLPSFPPESSQVIFIRFFEGRGL